MEQWGYAVAGRQFVSVDYRVNLAKNGTVSLGLNLWHKSLRCRY